MQRKNRRDREECPAPVGQLAASVAALGAYHGQNTEHAAEAARVGEVDAYRLRVANALLGIVQTEAVLAENDVTLDVMSVGWRGPSSWIPPGRFQAVMSTLQFDLERPDPAGAGPWTGPLKTAWGEHPEQAHYSQSGVQVTEQGRVG